MTQRSKGPTTEGEVTTRVRKIKSDREDVSTLVSQVRSRRGVVRENP